MNILVVGWKMPRYCEACVFCTGKYCGLLSCDDTISLTGRKDNCPLVEVPDIEEGKA